MARRVREGERLLNAGHAGIVTDFGTGEWWLQLDGANAEVHVILHPLPEPILMGRVNARLHLILPALHHLGINGPQPDSLSGNLGSPLLSDLRIHIDQAAGDIP